MRNYKDVIAWFQARKKWISDSKRLPLGEAHKKLYFIIHKLYWREFGEFPNLIDPQNYNDKIQWLKLFDQHSSMVDYVDKVKLKALLQGSNIDIETPATLWAGNDPKLLWDHVVPPCVVKTNHDSGTVFLIRDESFDKKAITGRIRKSLGRSYGLKKGEWVYRHIKPKVFIEKYIGDPAVKTAPPDFKFHCSNGEVKWLQYIYDRGADTKEVITDRYGQVIDVQFDHNMQPSRNFNKPDNWDQLISIAQSLSKPFKYVRVDLYLVDGTIYLGELTFFPLKGCYHGDGQKALGQLLNFKTDSYRDPVTSC